jgi:hypothetical protein
MSVRCPTCKHWISPDNHCGPCRQQFHAHVSEHPPAKLDLGLVRALAHDAWEIVTTLASYLTLRR